MKITTKFLYIDVFLVVVALAVATFTFLSEIRTASETLALKEQGQHLKTFWKLLRAKGGDIRTADGKLLAGDYVVNGNNELPDHIGEIFGCTATILMGDTRVSTNVLMPDGSRALGTKLQGLAYDAIFNQGRPYRGEALILGIPYLTAYDPIRNGRGDIIGALYVGVKKSDYFATYEWLKANVIGLSLILMLLFSFLAFLVITLRRKAADALEESEVKYRKLFELQSDAIVMIDRNSGEVLETNDSALRLYGYSRKEFLAKKFFDLSAEPYKSHAAVEKGQQHVPILSHMKKDGTVFQVEILNSFFVWQGRRILIAAIRDITERIRADETLRDNEVKYRKIAAELDQERNLLRALIDSIPDLIVFKDHESVYLGCNKAFEAFAGRKEKDLIGLTDLDMFPREVGEFFRKMDCQMMAHRKARRNEEWVDYPDGRHVFLETLKTPFYDQHGNVLGLIGISRDITERKRAEEALKISEVLLRKVFETIPDLLVVMDTDFRVLKSNWHGYEHVPDISDDTKPYCYDVFFSGQGIPCDYCHALEVLKTGDSVSTQLFNPRKNAYREIRAYPVFDESGNVSLIVEHIRDITELKRAEDERKKLEAQLLQSQKMEAVGQLAGGIAHDFNNILTAITGYAEIISMRMEKESPLRRYIEQVLSSSDRAAELVKGLLTFSRKQVLNPKLVDLCEIVRGLKNMLARIIREDIDFRTTISDRPLTVMADRGQIEQVLMNFITNARDSMPQGGNLSIDVSFVSMDTGFVKVNGFGKPGTYACVTVADTGCGMDEETQKKIFEPFYTTKEVGKGTGLGMFIIYGIVKQHNGYINLYSEPGNGTTFRVYLPLTTGEDLKVSENKLNRQPLGGTETVLLVEDDATVRELHRIILEDAGYTVIEAIDGQDGLAKFGEHRSIIDLLATDVIMPKIDGKRLHQEIERVRPGMKVLFMSGYTRDIVIDKGITDNQSNFITKPVTTSELLLKVRNILDRN
ncbi:MAG: PAS domain S-box protein [Geobacteraceae bacterium]|nr:PAS domain S-box protein [Geobacteraceae bacterium]